MQLLDDVKKAYGIAEDQQVAVLCVSSRNLQGICRKQNFLATI